MNANVTHPFPPIAPDELYFNLSFEMQAQAWQKSRCHSNPIARNQAYLGHLCLQGFMSWVLERFEGNSQFVEPYVNHLESLWEFIEGVPIIVGKNRLMLIPSQTLNPDDLIVPREWIDIPELRADYYLSMQVNLDEEEENCWICVRGFVTDVEFENRATYTRSSRLYALSPENWHQDLTLLWETLGIHQAKSVSPLPSISYTTVKDAVRGLSPAALRSPRLRLQLPFAQWGGLMANETWRKELYQQRVKPPALTQWFQTQGSEISTELIAIGWQLYQEVFGGSQLAGTFRRAPVEPKAIASRVKQLELGEEAIALVIDLMEDTEGNLWISPQLRPFNPGDRTQCLPPNLNLALLDDEGTTQVEVRSETATNILQLPQPFCSSPGTEFVLSISLGNQTILEYFTI
ncbi:DUF1822 family protein [Oscillatoria acuminata]|uniref:DUF1822 family protein n=1 Tax=Oscillatoria acuminata PCC 6304 TaxID=56110 RepID=K9TNZ1_9CYAN|nr:DUF1822 family protein [Oscillatoria acuminata]AFY83851.1 Protein of unknown function (DUF1822) [Oscillatoria acuminata PCC 6304]